MTAFVIAVALINVASVFLLTTATDAATVRVAAIVAVPAFSSTLLALLMMAVLRAEAKGVAAKLDHDARILEAAARFASTGFGAARGEPDDHVLRDVVTRVCTDMNDLLATLQRHSRQPAPAPPPK
jgi:hypothetical protein